MSGSTKTDKATLSQRVALFFLSPVFTWLAAIAATLLVAGTLDVADDFAWSANGPGLTFDECFNIEVGVYLVDSFLDAGLAAIHPETQREIYDTPLYNPDHPPLGRLALGVANAVVRKFYPTDDEAVYTVTAARLASAIEFGMLILVVGLFTRRWFGPVASNFSIIALVCMPRLFGHAHLASLEMCTCLTYTAFILVLANRWFSKDRLKTRSAIWPGVLLGLVFLTKIHAILLVPVVIVWGLWNWRLRSLVPLFMLFLTAFIVFFLGWPWLWIDPVEHLKEYFGRATERASLNCFYFGEKFADKDVPWHYPFIMFAATMPLGLLFSGLIALINRTGDENSKRTFSDRRTQLIFGATLIPLVVFAIPGVTVYDGVRLFLMSFPLFAVFVGLGMKRIFENLQRRNGNKIANGFVILCLAGPVFNLVTLHPCHLSYYSEVVGSLWKADDLGFESTYWGDSVNPEFLEESLREVPIGASIEIAPVLHPLQLHFMQTGSWFKNRPDISLRAYDHNRDDLSRYVLVIRRKADPWDSLSPPPAGTIKLNSVQRQGAVLADFYLFPEDVSESNK